MIETRTIFFDMDGTIADLYGVENWLECLINSNPMPYEMAKPMLRLSTLARYLNKLQKCGFRIGIISWLSKSGTEEYNAEVTEVKLAWLAKHLRVFSLTKLISWLMAHQSMSSPIHSMTFCLMMKSATE